MILMFLSVLKSCLSELVFDLLVCQRILSRVILVGGGVYGKGQSSVRGEELATPETPWPTPLLSYQRVGS